jgi:hypothetical protein
MKESIAMTEQSGFWPDGARLAVSVSMQFEAGGQPVSGAGGPITEPIPARLPVRRHRQELRGSDYLPSQVTGERSGGHLRQGARHEPLVADLASLDEV